VAAEAMSPQSPERLQTKTGINWSLASRVCCGDWLTGPLLLSSTFSTFPGYA